MDNPEPPHRNRFKHFINRLRRRFAGEPESHRDILEILTCAQQRGLLDRDALDTIQRVLEVSELKVRDIMIPRSQIVVVDRSSAPEEFLPILVETAHSRFPVIDGDRDKVIGILLAKDVLRYCDEATRGSFNMRDMLRPAVFIPESKRLNVLLREFRASRNHMAIVVDEYGGVAGLVTIEDVLEQIVGEIEDEHDIDEEAAMILQREGNEFVIKALLPLEDFNEHFGTDFDVEETDTVGGLVLKAFGRVPKRREVVEIPPFRFEVLHADSRRVHLLKMRRLEMEAQIGSSAL